jgi:hypothetical protein
MSNLHTKLASLVFASSAAGCAVGPVEDVDDVRGDEAEVGFGIHNEANITVFRSRLHEVTEVAAIFSANVEQCSRRVRIAGTSCTLRRCPADRNGPESFVDAGLLTATNGERTVEVPDVGGFFFLGELEPGFEVGDRVTISATGNPDGAPAFSTRVTVPASMELLAPSFTGTDDPFTIDRTRDLEVRWTGDVTSAGGVVVANLNDSTRLIGGSDDAAAGDDERTSMLECSFDGRAGAGRIPARALATLRVSDGGSIFIQSASERVSRVHDWQITASVASDQQARPLVVR